MQTPAPDPSSHEKVGRTNSPRLPRDRFKGVESLVQSLIQALTQWGLMWIAILLSPGILIWTLAHFRYHEYVVLNNLDADQRLDLLISMMIAAMGLAACYVAYYMTARRKGWVRNFGESAKRINYFLFLLLVCPLFATFLYPGLETDHPFITLIIVGTIISIVFVFLYRIFGLSLRSVIAANKTLVASSGKKPWVLLGFFALSYTIGISYLAILDHHNLGTHVYDLGIYDNIFWRTSHGDWLGCSYCKTGKHVSAHFDPILILLSPLYRIYSRAETLLVLQTLWLASGALPLYLMGILKFKKAEFGLLLASIYLFYPALHGVNLFDFHSLALVVPSLLWAIYFLDRSCDGNQPLRWPYWIAITTMMITREDMPLLVMFLGAYAILRGRVNAGLISIVVALAYLFIVKTMIMPDPGLIMSGGNESTSYASFYKDMIPHPSEGMKGLLISLMTNPGFTLKVLLFEDKVFFFLALLAPLLFLPILSGPKRILMLYGCIFLGLASRRYMYSLHFQYSSVLFPILLVSVPDAILRISKSKFSQANGLHPRRLQSTLMWTCLCATILLSVKYGAFFPNQSFKAGWNRIARIPGEDRKERYREMRKMIAKIPPDASVSSTSDIGPHISNRKHAYRWPTLRQADYLLLYTGRFKEKDNLRLARLVEQNKYHEIDSAKGVQLFKRTQSSVDFPPSELETPVVQPSPPTQGQESSHP